MYQDQSPSFGGASLKHIAIITMLFDHIGYGIVGRYILPIYGSSFDTLYVLLRETGRLAFPLFCFLIAEGAIHTSNRARYLLNLSVFALISEIPFDLLYIRKVFYPENQNVFFTLSLGLSAIFVYDLVRKYCEKKNIPVTKERLMIFLLFIPFVLIAFFLRSDYGATGVLLILLLYVFRGRYRIIMVAGVFILTVINNCESILLDLIDGGSLPQGKEIAEKLPVELTTIISFMLISMYNGKRGRQAPKYLYYAFYPLHLLAIWAIGRLIFGW